MLRLDLNQHELINSTCLQRKMPPIKITKPTIGDFLLLLLLVFSQVLREVHLSQDHTHWYAPPPNTHTLPHSNIILSPQVPRLVTRTGRFLTLLMKAGPLLAIWPVVVSVVMAIIKRR